MLQRAGDVYGPGQPGSDCVEACEILCFIPEAASGKDKGMFGAGGKQGAITAIRDDVGRFWQLIDVLNQLGHGMRWCDDLIGGVQAGVDRLAIALPFGREGLFADGVPP